MKIPLILISTHYTKIAAIWPANSHFDRPAEISGRAWETRRQSCSAAGSDPDFGRALRPPRSAKQPFRPLLIRAYVSGFGDGVTGHPGDVGARYQSTMALH